MRPEIIGDCYRLFCAQPCAWVSSTTGLGHDGSENTVVRPKQCYSTSARPGKLELSHTCQGGTLGACYGASPGMRRLNLPHRQTTDHRRDWGDHYQSVTITYESMLHCCICLHRPRDGGRSGFATPITVVPTCCSQFVVTLYPGSPVPWVLHRRGDLVQTIAPALPSQGPGLCTVPVRGALAILRGHS